MSKYYNPPEQIREVGRKLHAKSWAELQRHLRADEDLVRLYRRMDQSNSIAVFTSNEAEFNEVEELILAGNIVFDEFFGLIKSPSDLLKLKEAEVKWKEQKQKDSLGLTVGELIKKLQKLRDYQDWEIRSEDGSQVDIVEVVNVPRAEGKAIRFIKLKEDWEK